MNRQMVAQVKKQGSTSLAGGILQRKCDKCRKEGKNLQRLAVGSAPETVPPIVHEVLRSPGQPLDPQARAFMEPRFGHDFSHVRTHAHGSVPVPARLAIGTPHDEFEQEADMEAQHIVSRSAAPDNARYDFSGVRIHTDGRAAESAQAVDANAYTVGNHIVFGAGQFAPGTSAGRRLLAHELTHVMQQACECVQRTAAGTASLEPEQDEEVRTSNSSLTLQRDLAIVPPRPRAVGRTLSATEMHAAIAFNRRVVAVVGEAGIRELRDVLGISPDPAIIDEDFVSAVVQWQAMQGLGQDGRLGSATAHPLFREIGAEGVGRGQLVRGPTYRATTSLTPAPVGGFQQAGFRLEAEFADDPANGLWPSCCEVRQFIQWDAASAAVLPGGIPHGGFPAGAAPNTWIEDRDNTDTLRYGHRSGRHSGTLGAGNEYIDNTGHRNAAFGNIYRGRDFPGGPDPLLAGHFRFMLRVIDVCNGNRALGDDFLRITWP